jgi:ribose/xylose/arabinose/galactoside ABC-type transport system permease subunit
LSVEQRASAAGTALATVPGPQGAARLGQRAGTALSDYGIWAALAVAIVASAVAAPRFLSGANIHDLMGAMAVLGIVSVGQSVVILSGGIDLSVGMLMGLVTVLTNGIMNGDPTLAWPMVGLGLLVGLGVGLVNGGLLVLTRIDPLILTFGMLSILTGAIFVYTDQTVGAAPANFREIAQGSLGPFPYLFLVMVAAAAIAWAVLTRTRFGRYVYAIGGAEEHARRAGIATAPMKVAIYAASGLTAGIAGIGLAARLGSGYTLAGQGFELDSIVAVVLGGTSLAGGRGSVVGTIGAVLFLAILSNGLNLAGISPYTQQVVKGLVVVAAVVLYTRARRA